jgi:RNA polymerase sigma-70 factor, ECF subfamily
LLFGSFRPGIEAHRPMLYRIAYAWCHDAALADDLVQETLSKAWTRRAQLREETALKAWMVSIMNHCWLDHLRSRRDFDDVEDLQDELESGAESPEACCNREQVVACVRAAVARLPLGQRQVLTLVDLEEFGYAEVAGNFGHPGRNGDESPVARACKPENDAGSCDAATRVADAAEESEMNPAVVSDEIVHAFVDGELDVDESEKLMARMRDEAELAQRVCALRSLQNMVRLAYAEPPIGSPGEPRAPARRGGS